MAMRAAGTFAVALTVKVADCRAQLGQAERLGVQRFPAFDRVDRSIGDRLGRRKIRLADFHVDDVAAFGFQLPGAGQQFDDVEGFDVGQAGGGTQHAILQSKTATEFCKLGGRVILAQARIRLHP
jgi:hypothetical protein